MFTHFKNFAPFQVLYTLLPQEQERVLLKDERILLQSSLPASASKLATFSLARVLDEANTGWGGWRVEMLFRHSPVSWL